MFCTCLEIGFCIISVAIVLIGIIFIRSIDLFIRIQNTHQLILHCELYWSCYKIVFLLAFMFVVITIAVAWILVLPMIMRACDMMHQANGYFNVSYSYIYSIKLKLMSKQL